MNFVRKQKYFNFNKYAQSLYIIYVETLLIVFSCLKFVFSSKFFQLYCFVIKLRISQEIHVILFFMVYIVRKL